MAYFTGLQQSGEVDNVELAILEVHGGDLDGFILLRGDEEQLGRVRVSRSFSACFSAAASPSSTSESSRRSSMGKPLVSWARRTRIAADLT